jgi:hypothetical protein
MPRYPESELIHEQQIDGELSYWMICDILSWLRLDTGDGLLDPVLYVNRCEDGHTKFCLFERIEASYIISHTDPIVRELFDIDALDDFRMGKVGEDGRRPVAAVVDAVSRESSLIWAPEPYAKLTTERPK